MTTVDGADGRLRASLDLPVMEPGGYRLEFDVDGVGETLSADVAVREMPVLLIETDKPIYKPGQTIHGRVLVLDNDL